jgi:hypothetical protein
MRRLTPLRYGPALQQVSKPSAAGAQVPCSPAMKRSVGLNVISRRGPDPNGVPCSPAKHTVKIEKSLRLRQQPVTPSIDCAGFLLVAGQAD